MMYSEEGWPTLEEKEELSDRLLFRRGIMLNQVWDDWWAKADTNVDLGVRYMMFWDHVRDMLKPPTIKE